MKTMIIVLVGRGGELDRRTFTTREDTFSFADLLDHCGDWTLAEGDAIRIVEKQAAETEV